MKIFAETLPFIEGKEFDDALQVKIEQKENFQDRMDFVEDIIRGQSVLHIGCLDHVPLVEYRIKCDRWFHGRLTKAASECLGVDINQEGVELLRSQLNITNICYGDITCSNKIDTISDKHWDYAVFGEVLEHIDDPVAFLRKFISNYGNNIGGIIITVPNAWRASNIRLIFKGLEVINSDHRYWFSPYTIWKVVNQAGMEVEKLQMCKFDNSGNPIREHVRDFVLKRYPLLAEGIVVVCRQHQQQEQNLVYAAEVQQNYV